MKFPFKFILLQVFCQSLTLIVAQWCAKYNTVIKSRIHWSNGERMVSKRNFFGGIKYKYEPYVYSSVQYYNDYERINVCCEGYLKVNDNKCEPICKPSCPTNTHCLRPNICECNEDYRGYIASAPKIQCDPICEPGCPVNSKCIAPNKCNCTEGYRDNGLGVCGPICNQKCPENSKCSKPNECSCILGYLDNGLGVCQPVCTIPCPDYSECTKPETCNCHQGYEMNEEGKCRPLCNLECPQNSECVKPNECYCNEGYKIMEQINATDFKCVAKCDTECPLNSQCTKPNICECSEGYNKTEENTCEPVCENECSDHAICSEPNKCSCLKGYQMSDNQCQPICNEACPELANCTQPNTCECEFGYQLKLTATSKLYCSPVCETNCSTYGKCVAPNTCACLEGYKMNDGNLCEPVCSSGCQNGLCSRPEVCICNQGYFLGPHERCEPVCSQHCQNGSCIAPEVCQCLEGFGITCLDSICECKCHENYEPITIEKSSNHSYCQLKEISTTTVETKEEETTIATKKVETTTSSMTTQLVKTSLQDFIPHFSPTSHWPIDTTTSLQSSEICNEMCQCWQEFDEYGPLTIQQCTHLCVDSHDKPCLDLSLCQCDVFNTHLICRASDDALEIDDPILYLCSIQRFKVTTTTSVDMKSVQDSKPSGFPWLLTFSVGVVVIATIVGGLLYMRFRIRQDPILEYEL